MSCCWHKEIAPFSGRCPIERSNVEQSNGRRFAPVESRLRSEINSIFAIEDGLVAQLDRAAAF